jgi:uncharacterized protein YlxW (UPF0749 family)
MDGQLHEISQAIGRLEAGEDERKRQTSALFRKLDELRDDMAELKPLAETVKALKPEVDDWVRTKNRALGAIALLSCIAALMGAVGNWIAQYLGKLLK